jgi:hypothetical protein
MEIESKGKRKTGRSDEIPF